MDLRVAKDADGWNEGRGVLGASGRNGLGSEAYSAMDVNVFGSEGSFTGLREVGLVAARPIVKHVNLQYH
jgi:hypothetical protein